MMKRYGLILASLVFLSLISRWIPVPAIIAQGVSRGPLIMQNGGTPIGAAITLNCSTGTTYSNSGGTVDLTASSSLAPIAFAGNPNTGAVTCPATSGNPVAAGIDTTTNYQWFCGYVGGSTTALVFDFFSIGTGAYAVSGITGTVHTGMAGLGRPLLLMGICIALRILSPLRNIQLFSAGVPI